MNQRPIDTAWPSSDVKITGSSSSVAPIASAVSGRSITTHVLSSVGPSSGRRAMK